NRPVRTKIWERVGPTVRLESVAFFAVLLVAVPIGLSTAVRQYSLYDKISGALLYALYSIPDFTFALVAILIACVQLKILPLLGDRSDGYALLSPWGKLQDQAAHMVLPALCIAYPTLAYISRFMRGVTLDVIRQDYVRTARAKGLPQRTIVFRHIFRNT